MTISTPRKFPTNPHASDTEQHSFGVMMLVAWWKHSDILIFGLQIESEGLHNFGGWPLFSTSFPFSEPDLLSSLIPNVLFNRFAGKSLKWLLYSVTTYIMQKLAGALNSLRALNNKNNKTFQWSSEVRFYKHICQTFINPSQFSEVTGNFDLSHRQTFSMATFLCWLTASNEVKGRATTVLKVSYMLQKTTSMSDPSASKTFEGFCPTYQPRSKIK